MAIYNYKKGSNLGGISVERDGTVWANDGVMSRRYKTLKGAQRWLTSLGYTLITDPQELSDLIWEAMR